MEPTNYNDLYCFIAILGIVILYGVIRHIIIQYKESKRFWKEVDLMFAKQNKAFNKTLIEAIEKSTPQVIEFIKNKLEKQNTDAGSITDNQTTKRID